MSACERWEALIGDALAGAIEAPDEDALAAHLVGCERCRAVAARWASLDRALAERAAGERATALAMRIGEALTRARRRRRSGALLVAAGILAAIGVGVAERSRVGAPPAATIAAVSGDVAIARGSGSRPAHLGDGVPADAAVDCAPGATAVVALADGSRLALGAGARCAFPRDAAIALARGELAVTAAKQAPGRTLAFATAQARATVVGTRFTLAAIGAGTRVAVDEGAVRVESLLAPQLPVEVAAGDEVEVAADTALIARHRPTIATTAPTPGAIDARAYGAVGDGVADDTAAIRRAIAAALAGDPMDGDRTVLLPRGTYLVSDTLAWRDAAGGWRAYLRLQGAGRDATIVRLRDDASGFADPARPKPVIATGAEASDRADGGGSQGYGNAIVDLAVEVGSGDPGAVGIDFLGNNDARIGRVDVVARDGRGVAGIDLRRPYGGPCLIDEVRVAGFDRGVWIAGGISGAALTRATLTGQRVCAIENDGDVLTVEDLATRCAVPALVTREPTALTTIVGASLVGGAPDAVAIERRDGAQLALRNVVADGYRAAADDGARAIDAYASLPPASLFDPPSPRPLALPIRRAPEPPAIARWADVTAFGAVADDDGDDADAIQAAIDSGADGVVLPRGRYRLGRTVEIRGAVRRVLGCGALLQPFARRAFAPALRVAPGGADVVQVERIAIAADYRGERVDFAFPVIADASHGTLVLRDLRSVSYASDGGTGDVFLENVSYGACAFDRQRVWARRLTSHVVSRGGRLWALDLHGLGAEAPVVEAIGGDAEVVGGFCSTLGDVAEPPLFVGVDARLSLTWATSLDHDWRVQVRETRAGAVRELPGNGARRAGSIVPLFVDGR